MLLEVNEIIKITIEIYWTITAQMYSIRAKERSNTYQRKRPGRDECDIVGNTRLAPRTWSSFIINPALSQITLIPLYIRAPKSV